MAGQRTITGVTARGRSPRDEAALDCPDCPALAGWHALATVAVFLAAAVLLAAPALVALAAMAEPGAVSSLFAWAAHVPLPISWLTVPRVAIAVILALVVARSRGDRDGDPDERRRAPRPVTHPGTHLVVRTARQAGVLAGFERPGA